MSRQALKAKASELKKAHEEYKALYTSLEEKRTKNETVDPTDITKLDNMKAAGEKLKGEVEELKYQVETDEHLNSAGSERQAKDSGRPSVVKSKGQQFIESE